MSTVSQPEEPTEYQTLSIVVFKGATHDSYDKRHCALLIEHSNAVNGIWRRNTLDITGASQAWMISESVNRVPRKSDLWDSTIPLKRFDVGKGVVAQNDRRLRNDIYNSPIDNVDPEFNCQGWVSRALARLVAAGWLTEEEKRKAVDAMVDAVLSAPKMPYGAHHESLREEWQS